MLNTRMEVNVMEKRKLKVELRNETGKGANRRFRKEGIVTGVLYSPHDKDNLLLKMKRDDLRRSLTDKRHGLVNLEIDDGKKKNKRLVMIKDFQYNSLKKQFLHVDFYGVTLKEKITMKINVELTGESIGVEEGGILEFELREIEIECLPSNIPDTFKVDITNLEVGDHYSVGDIDVSEEVKILTDLDRTIASVVPPMKEEEVVEEEEEEGVEGAEGVEGVEGVEGETGEGKKEEKTGAEKPSSETRKEK